MSSLTYLSVLKNGFINYDDDVYVTANKIVQQGLTIDGAIWALTTTRGSNWHPITWLSHMIDCELFGVMPKYHHAMNLFLHLLNTILLFILCNKMTDAFWESAFIATVFAIHPLHVESVAWIAERKDVLSGFFWMVTLFSYLYYAKQPSNKRMTIVILLFAVGLMAKPMIVSLPVILLLLDYWPLKRFRLGISHGDSTKVYPFKKLIIEKIPLFVLALLSSAVTFAVQQRGGAMKYGESVPILSRLANTIISYPKYIFKTFVPIDLAIFYPYGQVTFSNLIVIAALLFLLGVTWSVIRYRTKHPYFFVGWFWFIITLIPVIGIVQVGWQSMADRYMYLPIIGLTIIVTWGFPEIFAFLKYRRILIVSISVFVISFMFFTTHKYLTYWRDDVKLFKRAIDVTSGNWLAYHNLGTALAAQGKTDQSLQFLLESIQIRPDFTDAHHNLGLLYTERKEQEKASYHYQVALKLNPNFPNLQYDYGYFLYKHEKRLEAIPYLIDALRCDSTDIRARYILGTIRLWQKEYTEAVEQFSITLQINPSFTLAAVALDNARQLQKIQLRDTSQ